MSVPFGSPLTSANTNSAFVSRTQDTSMVGKLDNQNVTDATSTADGAIHTDGGLGVEKKAFLQRVYIPSLAGQFALVLAADKEVVESVTTLDELAYLSGTTSSVQTQIDSKANDSAVVHNTGNETVAGEKTFSNDATFTSDVTINGDLTVNGTTTTVNSATLDVTDTNITVNKLGNDALSEGSGLTVDRTGTKGSLVYATALASKWKAGDLGAESEVITAAGTQTMTGDKSVSKLFINGELNLSEVNDSTTTGANAVVPTANPTIRLTNASLTSIANLDDVFDGKIVVLTNETGADVTINHDSGGTAIKRFFIDTLANFTLKDGGTIIASYNGVIDRWNIIGGSGTASPLTTKGDIYTYSTGNDRLPVGTDGFLLSADSAEATGLKWITAPSSGEVNTASNVGGGAEVFKAKTGVDLAFRTLVNGTRITATQNANDITVAADVGLTVTAVQTITTGGTITASATDKRQLRYVKGDTGGVAASLTPFGTGGFADGTEMIIYGESDTDYLDITNNDANYGVVGNFTTISLTNHKGMRLIWKNSALRWLGSPL